MRRAPWTPTPTERQANAFAAELLLPSRALEALPPPADFAGWKKRVPALLEKYGTGWELTVRHLRNRQLLSRAVEKALLGEVSAR